MSEYAAYAPDATAGPITLDQIRGKALALRDDVTEEITEQVDERRNQYIAAGVVVLVVVVGIAYLIGSRAGRHAAEPRPY
jgi:ABC-type branched-subunit amino acid transport system permease subunit